MPDHLRTPFGATLRQWRALRRVSQLELASRAGTPPRHVSFLETGRARPSREMVVRLADALDVPLAERNALYTAAGFAPQHQVRPLSDASLAAVREVIARMLRAHEPFPGLVLNAWYDVVDANRAGQNLMARLTGATPSATASAPPNLIALLMGPLRDALANWGDVVRDTEARLRRSASERPSDTRLHALLAELETDARAAGVAGPLTSEGPVLLTHFRTPAGVLRTLSTLVQFSGVRDVTVDDLHVELIYPADATAEALLTALVAS